MGLRSALGDAFTVKEAIAPRIIGSDRGPAAHPHRAAGVLRHPRHQRVATWMRLGVPVFDRRHPGSASTGLWVRSRRRRPSRRARPIDYTYVPMDVRYGCRRLGGPVLIPRMPPGITEDIRLTVTLTSSSPISLAAWTNPTWFSAGSSPSPLEASSRRPYSDRVRQPRSLIAAFWDHRRIIRSRCDLHSRRQLRRGHRGLRSSARRFQRPKSFTGSSPIRTTTMGTTTRWSSFYGRRLRARRPSKIAALSENPLYKIIEAFQCGYGLGSAGVDDAPRPSTMTATRPRT